MRARLGRVSEAFRGVIWGGVVVCRQNFEEFRKKFREISKRCCFLFVFCVCVFVCLLAAAMYILRSENYTSVTCGHVLYLFYTIIYINLFVFKLFIYFW